MLRADQPALAQNRGALERVAQFPNVPRPVVLQQRFTRVACQAGRRTSERLRDLLEERVAEQHDVALALAKRRQADVEHLQPVEEILAKIAALDRLAQIAVARRNDPDVGLVQPGPAESRKLPLLQNAQELGLRRWAHLAHLVEEQHTAGGELDLSRLRLLRAGERAPLVAEQLRLEQLLRQRGTVQRDERSALSRGGAMDEARDDFLSGTRFTGQEHRRLGLRHLRGLLQRVDPLGRLADDARVAGL